MRSLTKYPESIEYQHERLRQQHDAADQAREASKPKSFTKYIANRRAAHGKTKQSRTAR